MKFQNRNVANQDPFLSNARMSVGNLSVRPILIPSFILQREELKKMPARILMALDTPQLRVFLTAKLKHYGHSIIEVQNGPELLERLADDLLASDDQKPDLIIVDAEMAGCRGIDLLAGLRQAGWDTPFILLTQTHKHKLVKKIRKMGAALVFESPFEFHDLRTAILYLLDLVKIPEREASRVAS
jgi:DNA-binding response OmpR family regulator